MLTSIVLLLGVLLLVWVISAMLTLRVSRTRRVPSFVRALLLPLAYVGGPLFAVPFALLLYLFFPALKPPANHRPGSIKNLETRVDRRA